MNLTFAGVKEIQKILWNQFLQENFLKTINQINLCIPEARYIKILFLEHCSWN